MGGSIIIAEGAFPDTIVFTTQNLGNQDVFLNNVDVDDLTEKARGLTGVEGLYLYTPFTQEGSVQCDMTAGVPAVNYGGNTYAWNWYDEATLAFIWDMIPNQTVPSEIFICQYNTGEGNPNDPAISRMMIDTMIRYMTPRLVAALQLGNTTGLQELNPQQVSFQLYPNPSADFINLRAAQKIQHVQVKDFSGKIMETRKINEWQTEIPVHSYTSGFYVFEITFNEGILHQKVLITK
ncbi:MAG: T9SS type A sorting domain-containing protein [Saprospiraceae bacterium]|nr:T9SS type A sorting domain-containing protein [Saprospiraceae bacterium]